MHPELLLNLHKNNIPKMNEGSFLPDFFFKSYKKSVTYKFIQIDVSKVFHTNFRISIDFRCKLI